MTFRQFLKLQLFRKNCSGYILGNFWKHLGIFLFKHLVTQTNTTSLGDLLLSLVSPLYLEEVEKTIWLKHFKLFCMKKQVQFRSKTNFVKQKIIQFIFRKRSCFKNLHLHSSESSYDWLLQVMWPILTNQSVLLQTLKFCYEVIKLAKFLVLWSPGYQISKTASNEFEDNFISPKNISRKLKLDLHPN